MTGLQTIHIYIAIGCGCITLLVSFWAGIRQVSKLLIKVKSIDDKMDSFDKKVDTLKKQLFTTDGDIKYVRLVDCKVNRDTFLRDIEKAIELSEYRIIERIELRLREKSK